MKPAPFAYERAASADEAVAMLDRYQGDARLLAGGQSLVPLLNMRLMQPEAVIDVTREQYRENLDRVGAVQLGAKVLAADGEPLAAPQLEVAFLDRTRTRRAFQRIRGDDLAALLNS